MLDLAAVGARVIRLVGGFELLRGRPYLIDLIDVHDNRGHVTDYTVLLGFYVERPCQRPVMGPRPVIEVLQFKLSGNRARNNLYPCTCLGFDTGAGSPINGGILGVAHDKTEIIGIHLVRLFIIGRTLYYRIERGS